MSTGGPSYIALDAEILTVSRSSYGGVFCLFIYPSGTISNGGLPRLAPRAHWARSRNARGIVPLVVTVLPQMEDHNVKRAEHPPLAVPIDQAAVLINLSRANIYRLVKSGDIPKVKIGRRTLIRIKDLERVLEDRLVEAV